MENLDIPNDRITGELSNTSAEIATIVNNEGIFETNYSINRNMVGLIILGN